MEKIMEQIDFIILLACIFSILAFFIGFLLGYKARLFASETDARIEIIRKLSLEEK